MNPKDFELRLEPPLGNLKVGHAVVSWSMAIRENGRKECELEKFVVWKADFYSINQQLMRSIGNQFSRTDIEEVNPRFTSEYR